MKYLNFANSVTDSSKQEYVMALIDLSPSMDEDDWRPTRKAGAIKANIELMKVKARYHPRDELGIIGFSRHARVLHNMVQLGNGIKSLQRALSDPSGSHSTNFTAALELAEACLWDKKPKSTGNFFSKLLSEILYETESHPAKRARGSRNGAVKRIIMLTDGEHNQGGSPITVASRLKNAGVIIDCIGIGGSPKDVDEKLLKEIASRNPDGSIRYCFIGDQQQLLRKYENLAHHIKIA